MLNFYQINKNDEARTHDEISNFGVLDPNKSILEYGSGCFSKYFIFKNISK